LGLIEIPIQGKPINFNTLPARNYIDHRQELIDSFRFVRERTEQIASPYSAEDQQIQSMADASPVKWHMAHSSWFFEAIILARFAPGFKTFDEEFCYLFNSYYNAIGRQYPRAKRGLMSQPVLARVIQYRKQVTAQMLDLLQDCDDDHFDKFAASLVLGLNHEQQHQELIMADISHALLSGDGEPVQVLPGPSPDFPNKITASAKSWLNIEGCEVITGYQGQGFCFDNELAAHPVLLHPFQIASHLVSNADWIEFMDAGGYDDPMLWLADGWAWKTENGINCPLYWHRVDEHWWHRTLSGQKPVDDRMNVSHISYYEADAFASWKKARLPREAEWEQMARAVDWDTNTDSGDKPVDKRSVHGLGRYWEWTQSAYSAYPRFQVSEGIAAEYNGKFMVNQMVLRGSSHATADFHSRASYRNFFYPDARWQFSSLRLARDAD
jgi:ergothioneine biosynthesis protein EgtB